MRRPGQTIWMAALLVTVASSAAAFGSNYWWAHAPLIAAISIVGLAGLWMGGARLRDCAWLIAALSAVGAAALIQLAPLPRELAVAVSPKLETLLGERLLGFTPGTAAHLPLSIAPDRTWIGLGLFAGLALLAVGAARAVSRDLAFAIAGGIAAIGLVLALEGIIQRALSGGRIYGFWQPIMAGRPFGPFVNRNHFAGWMLMAIPVSLGYVAGTAARGLHDARAGVRQRIIWLSTPGGSRTLLATFAVLTMTLAHVLTLSRSGMIALAAALVGAGVVVMRRAARGGRAAAGAYIACLLLITVSWAGLDTIAARFSGPDAVSGDARSGIWADTIRIVRDFPLAGTGLNTYGIATLSYQTALPDYHVREAHNDYLQVAAEGGLLLGLPALAAVTALVVLIRRRFREDEGSIWWIRAGAATGLAAIALQSLVEFSLQMPANAALFAAVAALAVHDGRRAERGKDDAAPARRSHLRQDVLAGPSAEPRSR